MEDKDFHDKVDKMFESKLNRQVIRIKDLKNNKILSDADMNYNRVTFDSNLNIFKIEGGVLVPVNNPNFVAIVL